ncbi:RpiB/LacA/LacB family sugar-phosphate isomerase [Solibacillus sp. FSL W7-1436]|uniref:RpiB/LacA/LacB family sugar-phosphate isomerase n=1 Tax=Solibacillus sp. FSL W7-1436 TaxID=2921705 RepID=UPI0030F669F8
MKIGLGSDHNAHSLKIQLCKHIEELGHEVVDYGSNDSCTAVDYPGVAFRVATAINDKELDRGILLCGTGLGMAIAACKVPGIRAATTHDVYSAERACKSNNAQIITLGEKVIGVELAKKVVEVYIESTFPGGDSARKVQQIVNQEQAFYAKG